MNRVYRQHEPLSEPAAETWRTRERAAFDRQYTREGSGAYQPDDDESFRPTITPPWIEGGTLGGLKHAKAYRLLLGHGLDGLAILDYGCGLGRWSLHLASKGARVCGFDLSPAAIEIARGRAAYNGRDVRFDVADAAELPYEEAAFDLVLGISVLHHVMKYPGTADELRRVMRPGALAVFTEGLAENPLIELGRRFTMRGVDDLGDVGMTVASVKRWAAPFSEAEVVPVSMLLMAKRLVRWRGLLHLLAAIDARLFRRWPRLARYAGECLIVLRA
jgi:2-polyprenyl-3-methyl-5-hydroxy-6-metoxy-1,4-benzoquinol methylase